MNEIPTPKDKDFQGCLEEWQAEAEDLGIPVEGLFTDWALGFLSEQNSKRKA